MAYVNLTCTRCGERALVKVETGDDPATMVCGACMVASQKQGEQEWWAVYHAFKHWLVDTCADGTYTTDVEQAQWFKSAVSARDHIVGSAIGIAGHLIVRIK